MAIGVRIQHEAKTKTTKTKRDDGKKKRKLAAEREKWEEDSAALVPVSTSGAGGPVAEQRVLEKKI